MTTSDVTVADVTVADVAVADVAVAGASGYVGRRLVERLDERGLVIRALGRDAGRLPGGVNVRPEELDASDASAVCRALRGVGTAYYLVHGMGGGAGFSDRDRRTTRAFARGAREAGVERIVYLGGLGHGRSEHLASRHEVGRILRASGVDVVELRAAVILGSGSISFEMLRYLTERLPVMVCPRWVDRRLQPLAESDLLAYLEEAGGIAEAGGIVTGGGIVEGGGIVMGGRADDAVPGGRPGYAVPPGTYEVGSPDVTTYAEMMQRYASIRGLRRRRILRVPLLTPALSARWVDAVTPVDRQVSHSLVESLREDVVVHDRAATDAVFSVRPRPVAEAIAAALERQAQSIGLHLLQREEGLEEGTYTMRADAVVPASRADRVSESLDQVGGDLAWYGVAWAWLLRQLLGRLLGEHLRLRAPSRPEVGAEADWWRIVTLEPGHLVLASLGWRVGEGWLGYQAVSSQQRGHIAQVAAFRPRGLGGLTYWKVLWPVHRMVFRSMARHRADPDGLPWWRSAWLLQRSHRRPGATAG